MAGVGFELNKLLAKQGYTGLLQAYGCAALIGSGPWLVSVISLGMLGAVLTTVSDAMIATAVFAGTNLLVTWGSIVEGERWMGIGFLVAAGLGTVLAGFWVNQHVRNLEYDTFTPPPLYG